MRRNDKKLIILLMAVVVVIIVLIIGLNSIKEKNSGEIGKTEETQVNEEEYVAELADGTKLNTSEEFNNSRKFGNLTISNVQYTERNGQTVLLADVTNNGSRRHEIEIVKITILGENNEVITEIKPVIDNIEPGETIKLNASISADVANAKDFRIEAIN